MAMTLADRLARTLWPTVVLTSDRFLRCQRAVDQGWTPFGVGVGKALEDYAAASMEVEDAVNAPTADRIDAALEAQGAARQALEATGWTPPEPEPPPTLAETVAEYKAWLEDGGVVDASIAATPRLRAVFDALDREGGA